MLRTIFLYDESKILGSILYEDSFSRINKPIIFKILHLFTNKKNQEKIVSIIENSKSIEIIKTLEYIVFFDKNIIYTPKGSKFANKILQLKQYRSFEKKNLLEELIMKLKRENKVTIFLEKRYIKKLIFEIIESVYEYDFEYKSLRQKWIFFVLECFNDFSFRIHGNNIILKILEYEKKYFNTNDSLIFLVLSKSIINNENLIYYFKDKYASFVIRKIINIIYDENISAHYENKIHDFNKVIFDNFENLSFSASGSYIIQMFLEYEKKYINTNDSYIYKIFDKSIINNKNIIDYSRNKSASFVTQKILKILYNEEFKQTL